MEKSLLLLFFFLTNKQYIVLFTTLVRKIGSNSLWTRIWIPIKPWFHDIFPLFFEPPYLFWNRRELHENKDKCFVHPIFLSFLSIFFRLAHLALQNVNKDYVIFLYFRNFVAKSDQKPKRKNNGHKKINQFSNILPIRKPFLHIRLKWIGFLAHVLTHMYDAKDNN